MLLSFLFVPKSTGRFMAIGNTHTCSATGFLHTYALSPYFYNSELSVYFFLVVVMKWPEKKIVAYLEPYIHILPWLIPTIASTVFLIQGAINPDSLFALCDIGPYPPGCDQLPIPNCVRGGNFHLAYYIFAAVTLSFVATGILATWFVCWTVLKQNARMRRYSFSGNIHQVQARRRRDMMTQSFLYTFIFALLSVAFVTPIFADQSLQTSNRANKRLQMSILLGYYYFFNPIQGFWNCLIYLRLRVRSWREVSPRKTIAWAVKQAILNGAPSSSSRFEEHVERANEELGVSKSSKSGNREEGPRIDSVTSSISDGDQIISDDDQIPSLE